MKGINHVFLSGNLTRDAELRKTNGGLAVLKLPLAVNDAKKNADGSWGEYTNYVDCIIMGQRAEKLATALKKGVRVAVSGKLHYSSWEQDGQKRSKIEVMIDQIEIQRVEQQQQPKQQQDEYIPF